MAKRPNSAQTGYAGGLTTKSPLLALAHNILRIEERALGANLPSDGRSPEPEQIHQLRIAVRRLRVALRLFKALLPRGAASLRTELRWFGRALGEVRDLDVYAQSLAAGGSDVQAIARPAQLGTGDVEQSRAAARARLSLVLESERFAGLSTALAELAAGAPSPSAMRRWKSLRIADAAHADVRKSIKRVLKLGRKIDADSPPDMLHRLRIRTKRLRYELDFYADIYPSLRQVAHAAKGIQDTLGDYRDACLAAERLRATHVRGRKRAATSAAADEAIAAQLMQAAAARRAFGDHWQRFAKATARDSL